MIRIGILGCSDIARRKFIPALLKSTGACLAGIGSSRPEHYGDLAEELSTPLMTCQELISDPTLDLIYLSLPNHLHEKWSIAALEQGNHVLCEKPLGLCALSVSRMLDAADRNKRLLFENLMYLQHPQHHVVKALITSGRLGRLLSLRSEFAFPGPHEGDFRLDPARGGGAFHDMNRYPLSAALFFLKGRHYLDIRGKQHELNGLNMLLEAEAVTDAGESFSFLTAFGLPYRSFYELTGERGTIRVERAYTTPADLENRIMVTIDGNDESCNAPRCDHFLATIEHVCGLIQSGNWRTEHQRSRELAELADLFLERSEVRSNSR